MGKELLIWKTRISSTYKQGYIASSDESSIQVQESSPTFFLSRVIVDLYHDHLVVLNIIILSTMSA